MIPYCKCRGYKRRWFEPSIFKSIEWTEATKWWLQLSKNLVAMQSKVNVWKKCRGSCPEVFLEKGALKICSKFTGEHPCRNVITIKLLFGMGVLLEICCIFSEHLFLRTPLDGCRWKFITRPGFHINLFYMFSLSQVSTGGVAEKHALSCFPLY